jgi:glutamate---cysteine ligase / carboxylate-amine ligase
MQAIVAKIYKLMQKNLTFQNYPKYLINENKWRAARYGIQGKLIDFGQQTEVPYKELAMEVLEFIDDVVDELGSRKEVEYIHKMIEMGSGADRQLAVYEKTNDFKAVVDYMVEETRLGI